MADATKVDAGAEPASVVAAPPRRRRRLGIDLALLGLVGALLIGALAAGGASLYREFYSPSAFVLRYLDLLAENRAADAVAVPGVAVDDSALAAAGLPVAASDALLGRAPLSPLDDVEVVGESPEGDAVTVTVSYRAGDVPGETTFEVVQDGWAGVVPSWRFAKSPLAVIDLTVRGSMRFDVNGFEVDKRQVSPDGAAADPLAPLPLLVLSPGLYSVSVDTAISVTPGVAVLADAPFADVPVEVQAEATTEFIGVVQQRVNEFLDACATQEVLQPTGCPFGFQVRNRIVDVPSWSIVQYPDVAILPAPDGAGWEIVSADAAAHIDVQIRSLFDGTVRDFAEDVPFTVTGSIDVLPNGDASIQVSGENKD